MNTGKRILPLLLAVLMLLCIIPFSASAKNENHVSIYIDGKPYISVSGELLDGVTYVPLRLFSKALERRSAVSWDEKTRTACVIIKDTEIYAQVGKNYIKANGRCLASTGENILSDGVLSVPLRSLAAAYGASVTWDADTHSVNIKKGAEPLIPGDEFYPKTDLYWLAHIINAEACTEPFLGKVAVGNVVLNRVRSDYFPDDVMEVIFQNYNGIYQFTPVKNGSVFNAPNEDSTDAAKLCLEGLSLSEDIMYFIRESIAVSKWVSESCKYEMSIGNHDFYS